MDNAGSPCASILSTARSISSDIPTKLAFAVLLFILAERSGDLSVEEVRTTTIRCAPLTTWAFVTMYPSGSTMTPDPILRHLAIRTSVFPPLSSSTGLAPDASTSTTLGDTRPTKASTELLNGGSESEEPAWLKV